MSIGERIKVIRQSKGLSQKQLGDILGITQQAIGQLENDKTSPRFDTVQKIADALNVDVAEFIPGYIPSIDKYVISSLEEIFDTKLAIENLKTVKEKINELGITNLKEHEEKINSLLQNNLDRLNTMGKAKVVEYTDDLLTIDKYCKDKE